MGRMGKPQTHTKRMTTATIANGERKRDVTSMLPANAQEVRKSGWPLKKEDRKKDMQDQHGSKGSTRRSRAVYRSIFLPIRLCWYVGVGAFVVDDDRPFVRCVLCSKTGDLTVSPFLTG